MQCLACFVDLGVPVPHGGGDCTGDDDDGDDVDGGVREREFVCESTIESNANNYTSKHAHCTQTPM